MSDVPFGFRPGEDPDDRDDDHEGGVPAQRPGGDPAGGPDEPNPPTDPFSQILGALGQGGAGGVDLGAMLQQLGQMLSWKGGPVNWDLANQSARQVVHAAGDHSVSGVERRTVEEAFRLADTWLDDATSFPATGGTPRTWSRAEWVEGTQSAWRSLVEPVAARVSEAMGKSLPPEMAQAAGPLVGMMQQVGVSMWGAQVGQSIGHLAGEVFGTSDVGLPLTENHPALLPANVRAFGEGLGLEERDVTVYLALREAVHLRLFAHAPWLRSHLLSLVEEYARHVSVDTDRIESSLREIDPQRPEAIQEALEGGLFDLPTTPEQKAALERLELTLALVEGWVDDVVTQATQERLPSAPALREMVRRRRATGGPAEQTFATLVGLELRPRRLREASTFWTAVREARGIEGRDAVWAHPDLVPTTDDLVDPAAFLDRAELDVSSLDDLGTAPPSLEPGDDDTASG
jgi:putative hydrolase